MNYKLKLVYFSPTDTTKEILHEIIKEINLPIDEEFDLTNYENMNFKHSFENSDLVLLGFPVYSGRVPRTAINRFKNITGNKSKMIIVLTYGSRNYDDALMEIYEMLKLSNFVIIGMGTFVTQHSVVKSIGFGRPNENDYSVLKQFSKKLIERLDDNYSGIMEYKINKPFRKYQTIPIKPRGNNKCTKCKLCVKLCPENAINQNDPRETIKNKCISCMRCIKYCPNKARDISKTEKFISALFLKGKCKENKYSEII
jgi:ferredoxin